MPQTTYWIGDEVPLRIDAKDASGGGPSSVTVDVYDPANTKQVAAASATISGTTVTYNVAETITLLAGNYRAVLKVVFPGTVTRYFTISFFVQDPAVRHFTYGSVAGVEGLIGDIVLNRVFTDTTFPSVQTVQNLLDAVASELNVELKQSGYQAPVVASSDPVAYRLLMHTNDAGAAAKTLGTLPLETYNPPGLGSPSNSRMSLFENTYLQALDRIRRQELPATRDAGWVSQFKSGSYKDLDTGEIKKAIFTRAMTDFPGTVVRQD